MGKLEKNFRISYAVMTYMPHEFVAVEKACIDLGMINCSTNCSDHWANIFGKAGEKNKWRVYGTPDHSSHVLLVQGAMGKVWAAARAQWLVDHLNADDLKGAIEFGSCGGLIDQLSFGQMIFVQEAVEYDYYLGFSQKKPVFKVGPAMSSFMVSLNQFDSQANIFTGKVASGDSNVIENHDRRRLANEYAAHVATWETAAFAKVLSGNGYHWASVRVVVDVPQQNSDTDPDLFLKEFKDKVNAALDPAAHTLMGGLLLILNQGANSPQ